LSEWKKSHVEFIYILEFSIVGRWSSLSIRMYCLLICVISVDSLTNPTDKRKDNELISIDHCSVDIMSERMGIDSMSAVRSYVRQFTLDKITSSLLFTCHHCNYMTGVCGIVTPWFVRSCGYYVSVTWYTLYSTLVIKACVF